MNNWRYGIVIGLLLLMFMGLTFVSTIVTRPPSDGEETITNRSVYNARPSGYRAWHQVLEKSGVKTTLWRSGFETLDELPDDALMVIIEPYTVAGMDVVFGEEQAEKLLAWVADGHHVLLIDDFQRTGSRVVLNKLDVYLNKDRALPKRRNKDEPVFYEMELFDRDFVDGKILTEVPTRFNLQKMPDKPAKSSARAVRYLGSSLFSKGSVSPAFATLQYGKGTIMLGTLVDLADNSFLQNEEADNYQLLANIVINQANGGPIYINEYVHGYSRIGDLLAYYQEKTPLGKMLTQLMLVFMVVLWLSFTPWRPKVSLQEEKQDISLSAFIASVAGIYYRAKSASLVLSPRLAQIELTLRKRYRMGLSETARVRSLLENLWTGYSGLQKPEELATALEKARQVVARRQSLPHPDLLKLARQLSLIQEALQHGSRTPISRTKN